MEIIIILVVVAFVGYAIYESNNKSDSSSSVAPVSAPKPVKRKVAPKKVVPPVAELKTMTKQQLVEFADKDNIKVVKSKTKADIIRTISSVK